MQLFVQSSYFDFEGTLVLENLLQNGRPDWLIFSRNIRKKREKGVSSPSSAFSPKVSPGNSEMKEKNGEVALSYEMQFSFILVSLGRVGNSEF